MVCQTPRPCRRARPPAPVARPPSGRRWVRTASTTGPPGRPSAACRRPRCHAVDTAGARRCRRVAAAALVVRPPARRTTLGWRLPGGGAHLGRAGRPACSAGVPHVEASKPRGGLGKGDSLAAEQRPSTRGRAATACARGRAVGGRQTHRVDAAVGPRRRPRLVPKPVDDRVGTAAARCRGGAAPPQRRAERRHRHRRVGSHKRKTGWQDRRRPAAATRPQTPPPTMRRGARRSPPRPPPCALRPHRSAAPPRRQTGSARGRRAARRRRARRPWRPTPTRRGAGTKAARRKAVARARECSGAEDSSVFADVSYVWQPSVSTSRA